MKIGLVTPYHDIRNVGTEFITAGIQYLLSQVYGDCEFVKIEMYWDVPEDWQAASHCDLIAMCGNPRFTDCPTNEYWDGDIWGRLAELRNAGVPVYDLWAGSSVGESYARHDTEMQARLIMLQPRNKARLEIAKELNGCIARDVVMQRVYELAGIHSIFLPCSSWFAAAWHGIEIERDGVGTITVLKDLDRMPYTEGRIIATTRNDHAWATLRGMNAELITDPLELLRLYASTERVLAYRIHAAIPAASLGAEVSLISCDNRHLVAMPFLLPSQSFHAANKPTYGFAHDLDEEDMVRELGRFLDL